MSVSAPPAPGGPLLVLAGPTASGKSALAMEVARAVGGVEVVAGDAFTIYRGMDIGTAKPSDADRAEVPHYLVDVLDPTEEVDVAWFQGRARAAVADVQDRGRVPLLVGGAGLYIRAVLDELRFPPTDPDVRAEIRERWAPDPEAGHAHLTELDPDAAAKIQASNLRRTVRALEVVELTGERFSSFSGTPRASAYEPLTVACLDPDRAEVLRPRIAERAEQMVADGLVEELADLRARDGLLSRTARQAIGYAEAGEVLDGELDRSELAEAISVRTSQYARRQRSWFRRDERFQPPASPERARERLTDAAREARA